MAMSYLYLTLVGLIWENLVQLRILLLGFQLYQEPQEGSRTILRPEPNPARRRLELERLEDSDGQEGTLNPKPVGHHLLASSLGLLTQLARTTVMKISFI